MAQCAAKCPPAKWAWLLALTQIEKLYKSTSENLTPGRRSKPASSALARGSSRMCLRPPDVSSLSFSEASHAAVWTWGLFSLWWINELMHGTEIHVTVRGKFLIPDTKSGCSCTGIFRKSDATVFQRQNISDFDSGKRQKAALDYYLSIWASRELC